MAQASYKLILPQDTHQTYRNLMAQYKISHPFADRMREHFVATLAEFVARMQVKSTEKGLRVNIPPSNGTSEGFAQNKGSISGIHTAKADAPTGLVVDKKIAGQVPPIDSEGE